MERSGGALGSALLGIIGLDVAAMMAQWIVSPSMFTHLAFPASTHIALLVFAGFMAYSHYLTRLVDDVVVDDEDEDEEFGLMMMR